MDDGKKVWCVLTLFLSRLIKKNSQTIGWNSKGDSCSDLHRVYTDDFTILMRGQRTQSHMVLCIIMSFVCQSPSFIDSDDVVCCYEATFKQTRNNRHSL